MYGGRRGAAPLNQKESFEWFLRASQNKVHSILTPYVYRVGLAYQNGLGVDGSLEQADKYFRSIAANNGDHRVAMDSFIRSAKSVNTYTYNLIGDAYKFGYGVDKDHEKAIAWYMNGSNYVWRRIF